MQQLVSVDNKTNLTSLLYQGGGFKYIKCLWMLEGLAAH